MLLLAFMLSFLHTAVPHHHNFHLNLEAEDHHHVSAEITHQHHHSCEDLLCLLDCFFSKINHQENFNENITITSLNKAEFKFFLFVFSSIKTTTFEEFSLKSKKHFPKEITINNPVFIVSFPHRGPPSFLA